MDKFVETVKAIAPTFGGINLEDIKAPEAFEIERRLKKELDIPVMHDDQHGTAIISAAALKNALRSCKKIASLKCKLWLVVQVPLQFLVLNYILSWVLSLENIVMLDSKGVIRTDRDNLSASKAQFATKKNINTLDEAMKDADVFIGLSQGNIVDSAMIKSMAKNPYSFCNGKS